MEELTLYVDDTKASQEMIELVNRLTERHCQYHLEIVHLNSDHGSEHTVPYLETENGVYYGFTLTDLIDRLD